MIILDLFDSLAIFVLFPKASINQNILIFGLPILLDYIIVFDQDTDEDIMSHLLVKD